MKFCPNCGAPIEDGHKFCANCGEKLNAVELPPEPVYTEDPALLQNPALNTPPSFDAPAPKEEKVPELTLEPDLWGMGAVTVSEPAQEIKPESKPESAAVAVASAQAPAPVPVPETVQEDRPLIDERTALHELPSDYSMAKEPEEQRADAPNETLMLIWSIILTGLCSVCGIVGLVKTIKARKAPWSEKLRLLNSAKIWLIVGTVLHLLGYIGSAF